MTELLAAEHFNADVLRRSYRAADAEGEAALNALLYASGALVMSAVILVATTPAILAIVLSVIPWLVLAFGAWLWLRPALRAEMLAERKRWERLDEARAEAVDVLLADDGSSRQDLRAAAAFVLHATDHEERERIAERLLRDGE